MKLVKTIWEAQREERDSGVAMVMALLVTLVLVTLVASMTAFAIMGLDKGKDIQDITAASNAADTAVNHALSLANSATGQAGNGISEHVGISNAVYGSVEANEINPDTGDGQYLWRWYAERILDTKSNLTYDIYATGYQGSPDEETARTFKVRLESTVVEAAQYDVNGKAIYTPTAAGMFAWGAFGVLSVEMKASSGVKIYDSAKVTSGYPATGAGMGKGSIATDGVMALGANLTVENPMFMLVDGSIDRNRCSGASCNLFNFGKQSYGMDLKTASDQVSKDCPNSSYPDWVASAATNNGVIVDNTTKKCYGNIIFDIDTTVPLGFSSGRPAVMLAKGNIIVKPGVEVNRQVSTSQGPLSLRVYSQSGSNFTLERGTTANPTKFTGVVGGPTLTCNIGENKTTPNPHGTTLYGAMACNRAVIETGSEIWWDRQIDQVTHQGSPTSKELWDIDSYQEL